MFYMYILLSSIFVVVLTNVSSYFCGRNFKDDDYTIRLFFKVFLVAVCWPVTSVLLSAIGLYRVLEHQKRNGK